MSCPRPWSVGRLGEQLVGSASLRVRLTRLTARLSRRMRRRRIVERSQDDAIQDMTGRTGDGFALIGGVVMRIRLLHRFLHEVPVVVLGGRLEDQRWIGGGILRLILPHGPEITGVRHHGRELLQLIELAGGGYC